MYGKSFTSQFTGSLFGKPAIVHAVWTYAYSHMRPDRSQGGECFVELNPVLLAATFATTIDEVNEALEVLESADPASRSKTDDGRRLVLVDEERTNGPMTFRVVNGAQYRKMRDEEERRVYLREAKRKERAKKGAGKPKKSTNVNNVNHGQPPSTQEEEEEEESKDMSVSDETDSRIDPEIQELATGYNAICDEWERGPKHRTATIFEMQPKLRQVLKRLHAEDGFSVSEFLRRWREQKWFFVSEWPGWSLDSLATKPKKGTLTLAEKIWHRCYLRQKDGTPGPGKIVRPHFGEVVNE